MFGFLCKNLNFVVSSSRVHQNPSTLFFLRYISNTKNTNLLDSFTVSYLINSCGLSSKSALSASKHVHFETPDKPDSVLAVLNKHGLTQAQISFIVKKQPRLLLCNPQETILPKLDFFLSKGFSTSDIVKMSASRGLFLYTGLETHIIPTFNYVRDMLQSDEETVTTLRQWFYIPRLESLKLRANFLLDNGLPESSLAKLVRAYPSALTAKMDKLRKSVKEASKMGFSPSTARFVDAMGALMGISSSTWEKKADVYKRWGWSEEEIDAAFRMQPSIMKASEDKIVAVMDLFVNKLGWESSVIAKNPMLIKLSMKRLIARESVLQFLVSKGLSSRDFRTPWIFTCSETFFLQRFVNCYEEAPELLKLYGSKLALAK